jgi:hypothetical protein
VYRHETGLFHFLEYLARYAPPEGHAMGAVGAMDAAVDDATTITVWLGRGLTLIPAPYGEGGRLIRITAMERGIPR